jgi:hypothetical protein
MEKEEKNKRAAYYKAKNESFKQWRKNNREQYNTLQREAYRRRMKDPEYRMKMYEKKHEYYMRKKERANGELLQEA